MTTDVDVVVVSRESGVDLRTGAGLDQAFAGVQRIINMSNVGTTDEAKATAFFTAAGQHVQDGGGTSGC